MLSKDTVDAVSFRKLNTTQKQSKNRSTERH